MKLKVFIALDTAEIDLPNCISFLYPFFRDFTEEQKIKKYGNWFLNIQIVHSLPECDVIILPYRIDYYYLNKKKKFLADINSSSVLHNKLLICATKGDLEITPLFTNYHLYRMGGYRSKNKGNSFTYPVFFDDPAQVYFNGNITYQTKKTQLPVVGFCGQAQQSTKKWFIDISKGLSTRLLKLLGRWPYDIESLISTTRIRSKLLDSLEKSPLVKTNFIRHTKYRAGAVTNEEKKEGSRVFFTNINDSQYIICYRGLGNFSVRLYETLASGRIPVIVLSDNNLPFPGEINWHMFPVVKEGNKHNIAKVIAEFHATLSEDEFLTLQKKARAIWESYFTYKSFMAKWVNKYINLLN